MGKQNRGGNRHDVRRGTFIDVSQRSEVLLPSLERHDRPTAAAKQKSDMQICLDKDGGRFLAGDYIKGHVSIILDQEVKIKDLTVKIFGDGRVCWNERRSYFKGSSTSVSRKNTDIFLNQTIQLIVKGSRNINARRSASSSSAPEADPDDGGTLLPAGLHNFPFQFILPSDLPASSFDGRLGQVKYTVKAVLQRPWKFDIEREREIAINAAVDLSDEPELARPTGSLGEFSPGVYCLRRGGGQVTAELRIGRRGYVAGEMITFNVQIENNSRNKLHRQKVSLVQHVTFRASRKSRKLSTVVCSLSRGEILPGASSTWNDGYLQVPTVPPSSCNRPKAYKNILIKYTVSLFISHSSWTEDFCLPVTVVIGTSGFRRDVIASCLSTTPNPSPYLRSRRASASEISADTTHSSNNSCSKQSTVAGIRHSITTPTTTTPRLSINSLL